MTARHRLGQLLLEAARGAFPTADGEIEMLPSPPGRSDAVVAFTAHNVIATNVGAEDLAAHLDIQDVAAPMSAEFLAWLAGRLETRAGVLDLVMVAPPLDRSDGLPKLVARADLAVHPSL